MLSVPEVEQRILSLLDEFVSDNVCAMLNSVLAPDRDETAVGLYQEALRVLLANGQIQISLERNSARRYVALAEREALAIIDRVPDELIPGVYQNQWGWRTSKPLHGPYDVSIPEIVVTAAGMSEAKRVIKERGERWWR